MTDRMNVFYIIRADSPGEGEAVRIPRRLIPQLCGYDVYKNPVRKLHVYVQVNLGNRKAKWFKVPPDSTLPNVEQSLEELWEKLQQIGVSPTEIDLPPDDDGGGAMVIDFLQRCCSADSLAEGNNILILAGHGASTNSIRLLKLLEMFELQFNLLRTSGMHDTSSSESMPDAEQIAEADLLQRVLKLLQQQISSTQPVFTRAFADKAEAEGIRFEMVWTLACGMATLEAAYDLARISKQFVASPFDIPLQGDHRRWIRELTVRPLDDGTLGRFSADCFYWDGREYSEPTVAISLCEFTSVQEKFNAAITCLREWHQQDPVNAMDALRDAASYYISATEDHVRHDVYSFFLQIKAFEGTPREVFNACKKIMDALLKATVLFGRGKFEHEHAGSTCRGITFYLPFAGSAIPNALPASHLRQSISQWKSRLITDTDWPLLLEEIHRSFESEKKSDSTGISLL